MSRNQYNFYYYYCENNQREAVVYEPIPAEEVPMYFYGDIVSLTSTLGDAMIECMEILTNIFDESKNGDRYIFSEALRKKYFSNLEKSPLRSFIFSQLLSSPNFPDLTVLLPNKIYSYNNFLQRCAHDKSFCNLDSFKALCSDEYDVIKGGDTVCISLAEVLQSHCFRQGDLKKFASNFANPEDVSFDLWFHTIFAPSPNSSLKESIIDTIRKSTGEENPKITYRIYKLNLLTDLIAATLQEMFRQRKIIKQCLHCERLMVPQKRSDEKYCNRPSPKNKQHTCKEQARYEKRIERENKLSRFYKMRHSIKQMLYRKYGATWDEYNRFCADSMENIKKFEEGLLTETELEEWFFQHYKYKHKAKAQNHTT